MEKEKQYLCIDLKSFYASVECAERNLDPLTTNLVVADKSRTSKTICLAVSPSLKSFSIPGRARLFEVEQKVKEINNERKKHIDRSKDTFESTNINEINSNNNALVSYIVATPRMALYIKYSAKIYEIYLRYVASEDIHVYSIDEVFIDITPYLKTYKLSPYELANKMIKDVFKETKITATAGIGTNLYLAKVAMDIVAKHIDANADGVRIASLNEQTYKEKLWDHRPLTDFWRVGRGYASKLESLNLYTMGDIASCSLGKVEDYYNEDLLYKVFGINAELLIDHAWGYEPCTIKDIKKYKPSSNCLSSGQVLSCGYTYNKAKIIVKEMVDNLVLDLVDKNLLTDEVSLSIGYDATDNPTYNGEMVRDFYGRVIPKGSHGSVRFEKMTSSTKIVMDAISKLFDRIINKNLLVRRINVSVNHLINENDYKDDTLYEQLSLFVDYDSKVEDNKTDKKRKEDEKKVQNAILSIKKKYGKNSILKAMDYQEGATTKERNNQIGGHKA